MIFKAALHDAQVVLPLLRREALNAIVARMAHAYLGVNEHAGYSADALGLRSALLCIDREYGTSEEVGMILSQCLEDVCHMRGEFATSAVVAEETITLLLIDRGSRTDLRSLGVLLDAEIHDRRLDSFFTAEQPAC